MARIRSIEDRIVETREKLRDLNERKKLKDLKNRIDLRKGRRRRPGRRKF